ncbi:MAG: cytidylate kinase-like family protein [Bacteroidales bacterium]|nr:cytidylate kinase-like family protein [Bacteroidales bacterium]
MKKEEILPDNYWQRVIDRYFKQVLETEVWQPVETYPYISISRDFGCMANPIARRLAEALSSVSSEKHPKAKWRWINREILFESAKALDLSPSKIRYVFLAQKKTVMDEIVGALSTRYYKSDKKIRNTIIEVIRSIACAGRVIIVGRGGVAFGKDNPQSVHIKLIAPTGWRIPQISRKYNKTFTEAEQYIREVDRERKFLIDSFMGYSTNYSIFDLIINRQTVPEQEIISMVVSLMQARDLI